MTGAHDSHLWRIGWLSANVWLFFLLFPAVAIAGDEDLSPTARVVGCVLIALFAVVYMLGFRESVRREVRADHGDDDQTDQPDRSVLWFVLLLASSIAAVAVGGWAALMVTPFVVAFAVFHFSWRTAGAVFAVSLAAVLIGPAVGGVLDDIWFFSVILLGVGSASAMIRLGEERQSERGALLTQLAVSDERHRVARDVHDVLGHSLTVVILKAQVCDRMLERLDPADPGFGSSVDQAREQLAELDAVSRRALGEIRATVGGLRTANLVEELAAARAVLADAGVALTVLGDASEVRADLGSTLGWVVREATTNVIRHAEASNCRIEILPAHSPAAERVLLRIEDDGKGMSGHGEGTGLTGLRERVRAAGAELHTSSQNGTRIEVAIGERVAL